MGNQGIEEFFEIPSSSEPVQYGQRWRAKHMRLKSFEDLHKLWFVLIKEQNFLSSEEHRCARARKALPAPHRTRMVRQAMASIKMVLTERAIAEAGDDEI